jgi:hypothetical protein
VTLPGIPRIALVTRRRASCPAGRPATPAAPVARGYVSANGISRLFFGAGSPCELLQQRTSWRQYVRWVGSEELAAGLPETDRDCTRAFYEAQGLGDDWDLLNYPAPPLREAPPAPAELLREPTPVPPFERPRPPPVVIPASAPLPDPAPGRRRRPAPPPGDPSDEEQEPAVCPPAVPLADDPEVYSMFCTWFEGVNRQRGVTREPCM